MSPLPTGQVGTSYLVFVDDSFEIAAQRNLLLKGMEDDLRLGPEDQMAVVAFDGNKLDLLSDWTGDREALLRTLREARLRPANGIARLVARRQAAEDRAAGFVLTNNLFSEVQSAANTAAAAMRGVSPPPGRKVFLLLTSGWPALPLRGPGDSPSRPPSAADLARVSNLFEPVTGTANLLGYTIYPVYAPKPVAETNWADASVTVAPNPTLQLSFISSNWDFGAKETMVYMACETGGKPIFNSWGQSAFTRAEKDTRAYYWLGFTPDWKGDGRSHRIRVEMRRWGLEVRSRAGFSDLSQGKRASLKTDSPGEVTRFQTRMKLRKVEQRLVFAVQDEAGEGQGRAELDFNP